MENPADCKPYVPIPGGTAPSRSKIAREFDEAFTKLYKNGYHVSVAYTDLLRRKCEKHGPNSPEMQEALKDLDDVLQAKLTDIRSKEERAGVKVILLLHSTICLLNYFQSNLTPRKSCLLSTHIFLRPISHAFKV